MGSLISKILKPLRRYIQTFPKYTFIQLFLPSLLSLSYLHFSFLHFAQVADTSRRQQISSLWKAEDLCLGT